MIPISIGFKGEYRISVLENDAVVYESPAFDNLITNSGLDQIAVGDYLTWCALGTSVTEPAITDTALGSFLASTSTITSTYKVPNLFIRSYLFDVNTVEGLVTEVGIGWNAGCTPIFSRALLPDSIEVGLKQQVLVTYTLKLIAPTSDYVYSLNVVGGVVTQCRSRAAYVGNDQEWSWLMPGTKIEFVPGNIGAPCVFDGTIGFRTSYPIGREAKATSTKVYDYVPGTYYIEMQGFWNLSSANFTDEQADGVSAALFLTNGYGAYQIWFIPSLIKTCYHELKLKFRISWTRIE